MKPVSCITLSLLLLNAIQLFAQTDSAQVNDLWNSKVKTLLVEHCSPCHSGADANAGLSLDSYQSLESVLDNDRRWESIAKQIRTGNMPPEDETQFSAEDKNAVLDWIDSAFDLIACENSFPGNVTIRKLNRREYQNSIRDLLDVDYKPAEDFPGDDVGDGFDNIADTLSLPPLLMEKYLDAAENVSHAAIRQANAVVKEFPGSYFRPSESANSTDDGLLSLVANDTAELKFRFESSGVYALVIQAYGDRAANEYPKMSVLLDDKLVKTVDVKSKKRKPAWFGFKLNLESAGEKRIQIRFENDFYRPRPIGTQDRNLFVEKVVLRGPKVVKPKLKYLELTGANDAAAFEFMKQFIPRAFRTEISPSRLQRYKSLYLNFRQDGDSLHQALQKIVQTVLVSPQFLYKIEQPVEQGSIRELDDFERATSLSYFLWSSTPYDQLLELASNGRLNEPVIWKQQISRMLRDTKSDALIDNFVSQWLNLELLESITPDRETFPGLDDQLLKDMRTETKMLMAEIFRNNESLLDVLNSRYSFINGRLANHYGIENVYGDSFKKVSLNSKRSGVLTHASFLTLTSNPTRTSPVKRGKWIMENILGMEPPPPLADVVPLEDQSELKGSLRERMQQHRNNPACASCHTTMDAFGFALENFDGVGRFRKMDGDFEIDSTSELPGGVVLRGASGLQTELTTTFRKQFVRCFTEKLFTYALGRGVKYYDRCAINKIIARAADNDFRISEFVHGIAESDPFLKRGTKEDGIKE